MCDWLAGEVLAFSTDGSREVMARVEGLPFSIDWLPDGRLVATTPTGVVVGPDLAPYGASGQPFNEIVVDAAGRLWVDMPGSMPWEEPKPGIVAVVLPDGSSHEVADDVWFPNGMLILGEDTLVVAESHADRLTAWTITDSAELVDRRVWADLGPGAAPDGICADSEGAIWYAMSRDSDAPALPRAARCCRPSRLTAAASRACSAVTTAGRCTSWPTSTTAPAPRTASCSPSRSTFPTPDDPDDVTHHPLGRGEQLKSFAPPIAPSTTTSMLIAGRG
jgi:hypothetical protein